MKIKNFTLDNPRWDKFCLESDDCWFYHTSHFIKYTLEYGGKGSENLSFYIEDGNHEIIAIIPLIRHKKQFIFSGTYAPAPALRNGLSNKLSKKLLSQIFSEIDRLAEINEIENCLISLTPLAKNNSKKFNYNYLMKYGFENISLNTQIIDLNKDEKILWGDIKKSHRYEIKNGESKFKFSIALPNSKNDKLFYEFKNLHFLSAGRMTRSELTWELQKSWIENGNGILINAYLDDVPVGGIYTILYKNGGYYGFSANHPDYDQKFSISHSIQWEIIKWLKFNRFRYYDLGIQFFSEQPYSHPTPKEIDISLFKRHFGGYTTSFYIGIKRFKK